jgi:tetratricopeptide (TPR) repeat protein
MLDQAAVLLDRARSFIGNTIIAYSRAYRETQANLAELRGALTAMQVELQRAQEVQRRMQAELQRAKDETDAILADLSRTQPPAAWSAYHRHARLGEWEAATRVLRAIVKREPESIEALTVLGDVLAKCGAYAEAISTYDQALEHAPNSRRILFSKAHSLGYAEHHEDALAILRGLAEAHPNDVDILTAKGQCEAHAKDYAAAHRSFEAALACAEEPTPLLLTSLGIVRSGLGQHHAAVNAFHHALYIELEQAAKRWGIAQHLQSFREDLADMEWNSRARRIASPIFVATLPKSGTKHIEDTLCRALGVKPIDIACGGYFPRLLINQGTIQRALRLGGGIVVGHLAPAPENLSLVKYFTDRIVVHLRDPRQALLSYAHFLPAVLNELDPPSASVHEIPADYLQRPFEQQVDWLIDHYMPMQIEWMRGWIEVAKIGRGGLRIMFTTFEEFHADPRQFYRDLLGFYGVADQMDDIDVSARRGVRNFRAGETEEWRSVFSPAQAARATDLIPEEWFSRFGWTR